MRILVLVAVLLAGCSEAPDALTGGESGASDGGSPAPRPGETTSVTFDGSATVGLAGDLAETSVTRHEIDVAPGAQRIRVELWWNGTGDMDAVLESPFACYAPEQECAADEAAARGTGDGRFQDADGTPATPDSPSVVELDAAQIEAHSECRRPSRCGWSVQAYATAGAQLAWELHVTVAY